MRFILFVLLLMAFHSMAQAKTCRFLSEAESQKINETACETFQKIYRFNLNVDLKNCLKHSSFMLCEDQLRGQSIRGVLHVNKEMVLEDCRMLTKNKKVTHVDCIKY